MKAAGPEDDGRKRSRESSAEPRRTHRKTESRVLFSDVQAQNREMERINYEKSRHHADTAAPTQLRKGETQESPAKSSKQKRAEERRSKRQKLRRNMSPRSPDGGPQPLRGGVSLVKLDGDITQRKRRFARDEDAIQDASLHSTAWRNLKFAEAPANLLPDREEITKPYALEFDVPLEEFDDELKLKCAVSSEFLKPKPLTMASGTRGEVKEELQVDERVKQLIEEATPLVKKCHAVRANAIVANTRQQIATYLDQRSMMLEKAFELTGVPLKVSRLEKIAARRLLRNAEYAPDAGDRPHYSVGRTESDHSGHVYPEVVTYLSKIAPIPRSTTCMLSCGTQRVEDDPIIRFVPYFSAKSAKNKDPQFSSTGRCKDTLVGMDDEVNEYILRYVVNSCGGDQAVLEALQRCGAFMQPFANYSDVVERVTREELFKKHVQELKSQQNNAEISARRNRTIDALLEECLAVRTGANLRGRLQPLPAHILFNHLLQVDSTGVRNAPSEQYRELGIKYQDFFCRRCVAYNCRNHGREQPVPVVRVDPSYPEVKATKRLWRRVEEEQLEEEEETIDDADVEMEGYSPENGESINTAPNNTSQDKREQSAQSTGNASGFEATRRSMRAQTAASTKASSASSRVNAVRLHVRKLVRSKTSDASEYLGFDGIYQALTQDRKLELLSADLRCGPHCSKSVTDTAEASESNGFGVGAQGKPWDDSEIALLNKLEVCVGPNACVVAALLTTRSCTDVAQYLRERERRAQSGHKLGMIRSGVYGQNRERSNGVLGNSFEHLRRTRSQRMKDRGANHEYVPCNHDGGSCDSAQCSCMRRDHYCEKSCGCSPDCSNRFPGCHCEVGQCRTVECPCYFASRECDPDVCTSCGACELPVVVADEEKKGKTVAQLKICGNVNIMRGQMRKIGVSASETHGWGAYALENVKKGEFMYEYTGSLLSQDEAERRGNVYDKTTISFLFDLTEDSVVDATRKGNKSKFANHDSVNPKCFARIMLVNGDHRIGIYAKEDISVGDELFFDYGYSGVIPDWSQARIGFSKETASVEDDAESKPSAIDVKEEVEA